MRILNFFSSIAPVLVCLAAPDDSAGGGSSSQSSAPQPPEPTGSTLEEKFSSAKGMIADFFKQLGGAMKERDEAVGQVAGLTARAEKAERERDEHKTNFDKVTADLSTMTGDRDTQRQGREKAEGRVTLIESFCKHSNVDLAGLEKFSAAKTPEGAGPQSGGNDEGKKLYDQWQSLKASGDGKAATKFFRKHKAELNEYAASVR